MAKKSSGMPPAMGAGGLNQPMPNYGPEFGAQNPTGRLGAPFAETGPKIITKQPTYNVAPTRKLYDDTPDGKPD